ncbi:MAG TPA: O-antigen ligase family protein [Bryobacteraceae bacterium]
MSQGYVPLAVFATVFLAPLALAPHLLFYYDITPKVALLLLSAAIALALAFQQLDSLVSFCGTRCGRWYAATAGAGIALAVLTTLASAHRELAWYGSNWRRMGGLTESAVILASLCISAYAVKSQARLVWLLCVMCAAGLLTSLYGIAQYFGWDPLLAKAGYDAGEGVFQIVRPPGTLGHSDYFAAFLLWPVFAGIGLLREERKVYGRLLGAAAGAAGIIAILLSGSRGAALALGAGLCVLVAMLRPPLRAVARVAGIAGLAMAAFYISPAGARVRARVHWIGEDRAGGARPLLWRDALKMAASKPFTGFGLDTFVAEFPHYQSEELARAYPDFYHESPHNIFLDALTAEGMPGLLVLMGVALAGIGGGVRSKLRNPALAIALFPAFAATLVAHQFVVFTAPTAFYFYLGAGVLAGGSASHPVVVRVPAIWRRATLASGMAGAAFLATMAYGLIAADAALAVVDRRLDAKDGRGATEAYRRSLSQGGSRVTADLYLSQRWAALARNSTDTISKLYYGQVAAGAAGLATKSAEQQQNAWYNLAQLEASNNLALQSNARTVEGSLRASIAAAPVWYKPHWALARLLAMEGRLGEAEPEARRALYLDAAKDPEVVSTLNEILGSAAVRP